MTLNYEHINTYEELNLFVEKLNQLTHYERYLLFANIFDTDTVSVNDPEFNKVVGNTYLQMWVTTVGRFSLYLTTKINSHNFIDNPEMKTGAIEKIYFHLSIDDPGISQLMT